MKVERNMNSSFRLLNFKSKILSICFVFSMVFSVKHNLKGQQETKPIEIEFTGMFWLTNTYNFQSSDPNWFEMLRPTRLLDENGNPFADDGKFSIGIRPSRFGFNTRQATEKGDLITRFELDLVGGGSNVGETFFRVFNAYVEWNRWTFGKRNSVFMDGSIGPSTVEFFGPSGMVLLRNVQVSYKLVDKKKMEIAIGLENPSATSDLGPFRQDFEFGGILSDIVFTNKIPALTFHFRKNFDKAHYQVGLVSKYISWFDKGQTELQNFSGSDWGYGANVSGSYKPTDRFKLMGSFVAGAGVQNFLNDGTADVGVKENPGNSITPFNGAVIPFYATMIATEIQITEVLSSTFAFSNMVNQTFDTQLSTSFRAGNYFTAGFIRKLYDNMTFGLEYQYASRQNADFIGSEEFSLPPSNGNFFAVNRIQANFVYRFASKQNTSK
ncbi:MAG: DcaP family trimeric outer membrane transporter [Luteibaculaceae bacterium]